LTSRQPAAANNFAVSSSSGILDSADELAAATIRAGQ